MMSTDGRNVYFSNQFAISCGTVSLDVQRSKVLLIRYQRTGEYLLPKGRKDVDEALEQTAVRETFEETGVRVELLPVAIDTLATRPPFVGTAGCPAAITEPIAVTQRVTQDVLKIIFWYVAMADSTTPREEGTQQEGEEFDTVWVGFDRVGSTLSFDDDRLVSQAAIAAARANVTTAS